MTLWEVIETGNHTCRLKVSFKGREFDKLEGQDRCLVCKLKAWVLEKAKALDDVSGLNNEQISAVRILIKTLDLGVPEPRKLTDKEFLDCMERNSRVVERMPKWMKGSPVNKRLDEDEHGD